ncbi:unnamed protein product [Rotaria sordida]|uniref:ISXO2-like transposase domain-containing protein n=1 Tax=Rotaria sordida TaxID=392033 RepID=A0A814U0E6_9BILA|nr:unnamed protein product [Rotaria sordida]
MADAIIAPLLLYSNIEQSMILLTFQIHRGINVVEIDESAWTKRKYHRGRRVGTQWVFGGIDRDTRECFAVLVGRRDPPTLIPLIHQFILPGTTIYSDRWPAYNLINNEIYGPKRYIRQTVNHSVNFVDPITGTKISSNSSDRISRLSNLPSINLNLNDNIEKNHFKHIYNNINETYLECISCDRMSRLTNFSINTLDIARNNRDQRFYGVQIINHECQHKILVVLFFFDFGKYITIQESSIYELILECQIYPLQAIKCSLVLIHSMNEDWSHKVINLINRFIDEKRFQTLSILFIKQYIESQRSSTQQQTDKTQPTSSVSIEINPIDVRYEQSQKQQINNPIITATNIEVQFVDQGDIRELETNTMIQLVEFVDGEFASFWKTFHHSHKSSETTKPIQSTSLINRNNILSTITNLLYSQQSNISAKTFLPVSNNEPSVRKL